MNEFFPPYLTTHHCMAPYLYWKTTGPIHAFFLKKKYMFLPPTHPLFLILKIDNKSGQADIKSPERKID